MKHGVPWSQSWFTLVIFFVCFVGGLVSHFKTYTTRNPGTALFHVTLFQTKDLFSDSPM